MSSGFDSRLRSLARVVARVGLNLQPGQPLLITDPYDLLGVHPEAMPMARLINSTAGTEAQIVSADPPALRALAETGNLRGYEAVVSDHTRRLRAHLARDGAFLFLTGAAPQLFAGLPVATLARFEAAKWRALGPVIQKLIRGASQWTLLPAPTGDWAKLAGQDIPALWETLFRMLRIPAFDMVESPFAGTELPRQDAPPNDPIVTWQTRLAGLTARCAELNAARHRRIRYSGPGTDLTLDLPHSHAWCTARLVTHRGVPFVVNLPTEEVFTAPHKRSATGRLTVSRPVAHNGTVMDGIELEFRAGQVVRAKARVGEDCLRQLLRTDTGACRLGEVALVPDRVELSRPGYAHHHTILDENSAHHVALGDAYRFCSRAWWPLALNSSLIHLDLPLDAEAELS